MLDGPARRRASTVLLSVWAYPQWHVYGYQQPGLVALVVAAWLLAAPGAARSRTRLSAAGLLVGAAVCAKQTYAAAAVSLALFLLADLAARGRSLREPRTWLPLLVFSTSALLPLAAILGHLAARGALGDLWLQGVLAPLHGSGFTGYVGLPRILPLFSQDAGLRADLIHYLPPLLSELRLPALLASALYRDTALVDVVLKGLLYLPWVVPLLAVARLVGEARRARSASRGGAWPELRGPLLLLLLDLAVVAGLNRPLDWMHVSFAFPTTICLGAWVVLGSRGPRRGVLVAAWAGLGLLLLPTLGLIRDLRAAASEPLGLARGDVLARPADARVLRGIVSSLRAATRDGEPILVLPYHPLLYFLADRPPASRFLLVWPVELLEGRDREMLEAIDRQGVATVAYGVVGTPQVGTLARNAPQLVAALAERFRIAELFGEERWGIAFARLERRPVSPPGTLLLDESSPGLQARSVAGEVAREVPPQDLVRASVWPFERVLATRLTPGGVSELRLPLPASPPVDLELSYGMNPDRWVAEGSLPLTFEAWLERDGRREPLLLDRRDPQAYVAERPWPRQRFPLDGRPATLVLRIHAPAGSADDGQTAGWVRPSLEPRGNARPAADSAAIPTSGAVAGRAGEVEASGPGSRDGGGRHGQRGHERAG